ncbi:MAG: SDR family oxidoreductase [Acidobacteriota bacterium]
MSVAKGGEKRPVLVTGASSGLGLETAVYLAEQGFEVHATMRDLSRRGRLDAAAAQRRVSLNVLRLDITDKALIESAVDEVIGRSGGIYGLVNNAGMIMQGYFEDVTEAEMRRVFETNIFGTMAVTRAVIPHLRAARRGRIVFLSSAAVRAAGPGSSAYCASKCAVEGFGESLALEMAPFGVKVSLIQPGFIKTNLFGRNHTVAQGATDPDSLYYQWFQRLEEWGRREADASPARPVDVAKVIHKALSSRRPKLRYVVRFRAKVLASFRRHLPGELFERIWFRQLLRRLTEE